MAMEEMITTKNVSLMYNTTYSMYFSK